MPSTPPGSSSPPGLSSPLGPTSQTDPPGALSSPTPSNPLKPKPTPKTSKFKKWLTRDKMVIISGVVALILYFILTIVSGVGLMDSFGKYHTEPVPDKCLNSTEVKKAVGDGISDAVKTIFWTWCLIIFVVTFMIYGIYIISGWMRSRSLIRVWFFIIGFISLLYFVPCTYIFSFGHLTTGEKTSFWVMLGVTFFFRIIDIVIIYLFLKEIKAEKAAETVVPSEIAASKTASGTGPIEAPTDAPTKDDKPEAQPQGNARTSITATQPTGNPEQHSPTKNP